MRRNAGLPVLLVLITFLSSCSNYHTVLRRPDIRDGKKFGTRDFPESNQDPFRFFRKENVMLPPLDQWVTSSKALKKHKDSEDFIEDNKTTAMLIIRKDTIIYEKYYNGYTRDSLTQVFSVTKPIITSLLDLALRDGLLPSLDIPVTDYINVKNRRHYADQLRIIHLAQMMSGINHNDYRRFIKTLRFYYSKNADDYLRKVKVRREPGTKFAYKSVETQLLGSVLERVYGVQDLSGLFYERLWGKLDPEYPAQWSLDSKQSGNLKYYGGINAHPVDIAKFGRLYLNDGRYDNEQILSADWVNKCESEERRNGRYDYCLGWWYDEYIKGERNVYYGAGFNGQYLLINEDNDVIIVRLGETKNGYPWYDYLANLSQLF